MRILKINDAMMMIIMTTPTTSITIMIIVMILMMTLMIIVNDYYKHQTFLNSLHLLVEHFIISPVVLLNWFFFCFVMVFLV